MNFEEHVQKRIDISGEEKVNLAFSEMTGLKNIKLLYKHKKPFKNINILGCVTPTPETGAFIITLKELGANIRWCSDNKHGVDNSIVSYLKNIGIKIYAESNMDNEQYFDCMEQASRFKTGFVQIIDDGADIVNYLAKNKKKYFDIVIGITEQTSCGINLLRQLYQNKSINSPAININNCYLKENFDNYYGIYESLIVSILKILKCQISTKYVSVFGYGSVGRGAAFALRNYGAKVRIVDHDILKLVKAYYDGFEIFSPNEALESSDICITATGCANVIKGKWLETAKDGLILCNIGHGYQEYDIPYLEKYGIKQKLSIYLDQYKLNSGIRILSLCNGGLVNIISGGGNSPKLMSLTFTLHILGQMQFIENPEYYKEYKLYNLTKKIEVECAKLNFPFLEKKIYKLDSTQKSYMGLND
jgi:adenosylhomocysteinase